jgi:hypothetical protein
MSLHGEINFPENIKSFFKTFIQIGKFYNASMSREKELPSLPWIAMPNGIYRIRIMLSDAIDEKIFEVVSEHEYFEQKNVVGMPKF